MKVDFTVLAGSYPDDSKRSGCYKMLRGFLVGLDECQYGRGQCSDQRQDT